MRSSLLEHLHLNVNKASMHLKISLSVRSSEIFSTRNLYFVKIMYIDCTDNLVEINLENITSGVHVVDRQYKEEDLNI